MENHLLTDELNSLTYYQNVNVIIMTCERAIVSLYDVSF